MLSFLTLLIPGVRLRMRSFQFALHRAWVRLDSEALVRWSSEIRQDLFWWLDHERLHERLELVSSLGRVSPQLDLWSDSSDVGWALVSILFWVRVDPEPVSVQQLRRRWPVSIDLFVTSLFHRCLPYFSLFHDPNALRPEVLLQPWNGWQAYAFPPYALLPVIL